MSGTPEEQSRSGSPPPLEIGLSNSTTRTNESADDSLDESVFLNQQASEDNDTESIALLRQIFPGEPRDALRQLHNRRLSSPSTPQRQRPSPSARILSASSTISTRTSPSSLGLLTPKTPSSRSILLESDRGETGRGFPTRLPNDFLRLPAEIAVRRFHTSDGQWRYAMIDDMEQRVANQLELAPPQATQLFYSKVVFRDKGIGLGMTLVDHRGVVRVYSLTQSDDGRTEWHAASPLRPVAVERGDALLGINGSALLETYTPGQSLLRHAAEMIHTSPEPIVLHFQKAAAGASSLPLLPPPSPQRLDAATPPSPPSVVSLQWRNGTPSTPSLLDETLLESSFDESSFLDAPYADQKFHSTPLQFDYPKHASDTIHPFATSLMERGLMDAHKDEDAQTLTSTLAQLTERTQHWESMSSFHIAAKSPNSRGDEQQQDVFIPMMGVRKALCVRILNSFLDGNNMAYTIWIYDVESGHEWYAPVRYYRDFQDLRAATLALYAPVNQIPFPRQTMSLFGSPLGGGRESPEEQQHKCQQLEHFLRSLCMLIYQGRLHPDMAEVAIHVQSFLGCENVTRYATVSKRSHPEGSSEEERIRFHLKRSLQLYAYRLFLLQVMSETVDHFVDTARSHGPRLQDIEALQAQGRSVLKSRALKDLGQIQVFLDRLQDLILDGCMDDFRGIAQREEYEAIHRHISTSRNAGGAEAAYWDRLVREAVREQIEIEVYVPLRSVASRWLVSGWRHEDMEVQFKINELRRRPPSFFRIPTSSHNPWMAASNILKEGVGLSTLPCIKLRAIVDAAREISKAFEPETSVNGSTEKVTDEQEVRNLGLGADQFLPIFIFCVIHSQIDRPCALCVLLRTFCDRINKIGEIGYYLASFEAAVTHIQDWDLSEDSQQMRSFLSVNLDGD